jgi:hypothetical protein
MTPKPVPINYTFIVDLSIGGSLPNFQVLSGDFHLPTNTMMPEMHPGDSLTFQFLGRPIQNGMLYARPLEPSEEPAPFKGGLWEYPVQDGTSITIGHRLGYWVFTISGTYQAIITPTTHVQMPFLVDPEILVGTGNTPP